MGYDTVYKTDTGSFLKLTPANHAHMGSPLQEPPNKPQVLAIR